MATGSSLITLDFYSINTITWSVFAVSILFFEDLGLVRTVFTLFSFFV